MPSPPSPPPLGEVAAAVVESHVDRSVAAAIAGFLGKTSPLEVLRVASRAAALHYDPSFPRPPHGLVTLGAVAGLLPLLPPDAAPIAALQAVALSASEKKAPTPARAPLIVAGEITHLGRSFLFAARDGDLPQAEAVLLGIVSEGRERRMAGDMLFRAAVEDMGDRGHKLVVAVKLWQLARALGFRDARTILRPAVQYLVAGPRDSTAYKTILSVLGREWVDLEALAAAGHLLDEAGREKLSACLRAPDDPACASGVLGLLREGYASTSIAEALSCEAARRVVASKGLDRDAALGVAFVHAARSVLTFTRSPERLYALFQAALRVRAAPAHLHLPPVPDAPTEAEEVRRISDAIRDGRPDEAAYRTSSYVSRKASVAPLLVALAAAASRGSATSDEGLRLLLADVCTAETLATRAPEPAMALATVLASHPKDPAPADAWAKALGL